jgi:hypothetical protein
MTDKSKTTQSEEAMLPLDRKVPALKQNLFQEAAAARNEWAITPEPGVNPDDLLKPEYWAHVAWRLRPLDLVEVRAADGRYWGQLLVTNAGRLWATVRPIIFIETEVSTDDVVVEGLVIRWRGGVGKWSVLRHDDRGLVVLQEGMEHKSDAISWAANHRRQVA